MFVFTISQINTLFIANPGQLPVIPMLKESEDLLRPSAYTVRLAQQACDKPFTKSVLCLTSTSTEMTVHKFHPVLKASLCAHVCQKQKGKKTQPRSLEACEITVLSDTLKPNFIKH